MLGRIRKALRVGTSKNILMKSKHLNQSAKLLVINFCILCSILIFLSFNSKSDDQDVTYKISLQEIENVYAIQFLDKICLDPFSTMLKIFNGMAGLSNHSSRKKSK